MENLSNMENVQGANIAALELAYFIATHRVEDIPSFSEGT